MQEFKTYDEMPAWLIDYVVTVASVEKIEQVPIIDINNFIFALEDYENRAFAERMKEFEHGWISNQG